MIEAWVLPEIDDDACTACGVCVSVCPEDVVAVRDQALVFVRPEACTYCGLCEDACPEGAIALRYEIVWDESTEAS